jgi:hypothetical protein
MRENGRWMACLKSPFGRTFAIKKEEGGRKCEALATFKEA